MCLYYEKCQMLVFSLFQAVTAKTIQEVCTKYIYDKSPALAAVGKPSSFLSSTEHLSTCLLFGFNCLLLILRSH